MKQEIIRRGNIPEVAGSRWKKICEDAGLADLKFHNLRKTFGSLLAQNGVSTAVTQKLLEHSSSRLTNKVYTNVDPVLRHAVEQLPEFLV
ncbi:MAG: tyrosine-type recombinase/integrase [Planctomycetota bacterium]